MLVCICLFLTATFWTASSAPDYTVTVTHGLYFDIKWSTSSFVNDNPNPNQVTWLLERAAFAERAISLLLERIQNHKAFGELH